jgi:hypothetical protein
MNESVQDGKSFLDELIDQKYRSLQAGFERGVADEAIIESERMKTLLTRFRQLLVSYLDMRIIEELTAKHQFQYYTDGKNITYCQFSYKGSEIQIREFEGKFQICWDLQNEDYEESEWLFGRNLQDRLLAVLVIVSKTNCTNSEIVLS